MRPVAARPDPAARPLARAGVAVGMFALALQFVLTIPASMAAGRSLAGSVYFYFGFFTILTNLLAVLAYSSVLGLQIGPRVLRKRRVHGGVTAAIVVVGLVYAVVLSRLWQPHGLALLCDVLLHYVAPTLFVAWWVATADGASRAKDAIVWLVWPFAYLVWAGIRWFFTGEAPYPFLDPVQNGYTQVLINVGVLFVVFLVAGLLTVAADHLAAQLAKRAERAP